jgi:DNA-binding IclR family transcriptional regulator
MKQETVCGPAPALSRGLAVVDVLADGEPRRLERLVRELGFPKSSLLRLLETLCACDVLTRDPDGRYRALKRMMPLHTPQWTEHLLQTLQALATTTGQTAEWWELRSGSMLLINQAYANTEVHVRAQTGFVRAFSDECEAVAVAGASLHHVRLSSGCWRHGPGQSRVTLSAAEARALVDATTAAGEADDPFCNTNGVRRFARVVSGPHPGVLAVAAFVPYGGHLDEDSLRTALKIAMLTLTAQEQGE